MAERFRLHGEACFRFITTPGIEPTNNLAEQAIRFVVIDRRVTQGTRGETGRRWRERIWTVIASCAQQGRSVFEFLHNSFRAYLDGIGCARVCRLFGWWNRLLEHTARRGKANCHNS